MIQNPARNNHLLVNEMDYSPITRGIFEDVNASRDLSGGSKSFDGNNSFSSLDSSAPDDYSIIDVSDASIVRGKMVTLKTSEIDSKDVLCGRDKVSFSHVGNKKFRIIIDEHRDKYQSATVKENKTKIIVKIVKMVKENGGRFLKRYTTSDSNSNSVPNSDSDSDSSCWYVVNDQCAHEKVSHALRSCKHRKKNKPITPRKKKQQTKKILTDAQEKHFKKLLKYQATIFQSYLQRYKEDGLIRKEAFEC